MKLNKYTVYISGIIVFIFIGKYVLALNNNLPSSSIKNDTDTNITQINKEEENDKDNTNNNQSVNDDNLKIQQKNLIINTTEQQETQQQDKKENQDSDNDKHNVFFANITNKENTTSKNDKNSENKKTNKDENNNSTYTIQNLPIDENNGKIEASIKKIILEDGTKNIIIELKPEIKTYCNEQCNCQKNVSNNKKITKKTTKTKPIKQTTKKLATISAKKDNANKITDIKNNTVKKTSPNIYVINRIIGIDENDIITEETLKKIEIDQQNITNIYTSSQNKDLKKNQSSKQQYQNKIIKQDIDSVVKNEQIKYGEVAFVDEYLDY